MFNTLNSFRFRNEASGTRKGHPIKMKKWNEASKQKIINSIYLETQKINQIVEEAIWEELTGVKFIEKGQNLTFRDQTRFSRPSDSCGHQNVAKMSYKKAVPTQQTQISQKKDPTKIDSTEDKRQVHLCTRSTPPSAHGVVIVKNSADETTVSGTRNTSCS